MNEITPSGFNPFTAASKAIGNAAGRSMNFQQSAALVQMHHASMMEQLHTGHQLAEQSAKSEHRRGLATQRISHQQAKDLETHKAGLAAQQTQAQHANTIQAATHQAGLVESAAASSHTRNLELLKGVKSAAQPGSKVDYSSGDVRLGFTLRTPKPKVATAAPSAPATPEVKKPKFAHRDPVTKKITGYFDEPQKQLPKNKKAAPRKRK